jgi:hypothetical protein
MIILSSLYLKYLYDIMSELLMQEILYAQSKFINWP